MSILSLYNVTLASPGLDRVLESTQHHPANGFCGRAKALQATAGSGGIWELIVSISEEEISV